MNDEPDWYELAPQQRRRFVRQRERVWAPARVVVELSGRLDRARLDRAWAIVCEEHALLRARLERVTGLRAPIVVIDDAGGGPDLELVSSSETEHELRVTLPALLADTASMLSLIEILAERCDDAGESSEPTQFEQFARWQAALLEDDDERESRARASAELEQALALDRQLRERSPDFLRPGDHATPIRIELPLEDSLAQKIVTTGRAESLLLASFAVLLARRSGIDELGCGYIDAGRRFPELERCLGLLAQTLPLRLRVDARESFAALWDDVEQRLDRLAAEQQLPVLCLREHEQDAFAAGFRFETITSRWAGAGCRWHLRELGDHVDDFALLLEARQGEHGLRLTLVHDRDAISPQRASWLGEALIDLLRTILEQPERRVADIPVVGASERAWIDAACRGPTADIAGRLLHERIAEVAERHPDAIALEDDRGQLSYAALRGRMAAWAGMLRERGVGPEVVVALCFERSLTAIVAQLAVLAAGGAFMPLDERAPAARLASLLERSPPHLLLTQTSLRERLSAHPRERSICLDEPPWSSARPRTRLPPVRLHERNAAYVLHTSGSTGVPKPVIVEHQQILAYLDAILPGLDLPARARGALVSTLAADLGNTILWPMLAGGGRLYVPDWARIVDPELLSDAFAARAIELLKIVPSHLDALLGDRPELLPRARLILGGEAPRPGLIERVAALAPELRVFNHYGPTETTVGVIAGEIASKQHERPPLGRPLASVHVAIVGEDANESPAGGFGELEIGGPQIARGYAIDPRLTASRFVPNRMSRGARAYRTGDRVRLDEHGAIEFHGRFDTQVKIRGHRVELGELERALLDPELGLRDAVVDVVHVDGDPRLVAYLVPDAATFGPRLAELEHTQIAAWQTVFNATHGALEPQPGVTFSAFGWNSSFTGEQLPDDHIREQVMQTVERLRELEPTRTLELGCGTGLILFELAPRCEWYLGLDPAADVLRYTRAVLDSIGSLRERVELRQLGAAQLDQLGEQRFDTIIVNSVIQYFPSVEYLVDTLARLSARLDAGGRLFIGDVRSARLLDAFHAAVELFRAAPETPTGVLVQRMVQQRCLERELVIDPDFWLSLRDRIPAITGVEIHLKRGRWHNELSKYRYDVILHVGARANELALRWHDCASEAVSLADIEAWIEQSLARGEPGLGLAKLRNARVAVELELTRRLADARASERAGQLRRLASERDNQAIDPEQLARLAERRGYLVNLRWSELGEDDRFDAVLVRPGHGRPGLVPSRDSAAERPISAFANAPLLDELAAELIPRVRARLAERLPDYMLPAVFMLLPALPLSRNGKVDRTCLPAPSFARRDLSAHYVAPRTGLESQIAAIWREVLQVERVGIHDDFFDLGGHSLLATQVVARMRSVVASKLPLKTFFDGPPTIARLAQILGSGDEASSDVLELVARSDDPSHAPLTHAQARMLFEPDPSHPFHNIAFAFYLDGELDLDALRRGLDLLIARHSAWRTVFELGSTPADSRQRILDAAGFPLTIIDLEGSPNPEARAREVAEQEKQLRFDLARELPVRATLLRLGEREHAMVLVVHHVVSDGWTTGVFSTELSQLYRALRAGEPNPLAPLPVQYGDFAAWQSRWLRGRALDQQLGYWLEHLSGRALELDLPTDHPRPERQTWRGAGLAVALPAALSRATSNFASSHGASLFITLLAVYVVELHLLCGQTDIGVGTPVANRTHVALEPLLGCFINFLVIQTDLEGDPSFDQVLDRVRALCVRAYDHQDAPFLALVDALAVDPGYVRPPLFQVMFELANVPGERRLMLDGLRLRGLEFDHGTSEFELNLILQQGDAGLEGWLLYRTELFERESIEALFAGYQRLLAAVIDDPRRRISSYRGCLPASWPATDVKVRDSAPRRVRG